MIKRTLSEKLIQLSQKFPVLAVIGPRQSGKTTLVKAVFYNKKYLSLEDPETREFAISDPKGFLHNIKDGAILDEVQRVPELFSYIHADVDNDKRDGKFILTGSNNFLLNEKISQSLAGRVAIFNLLPFSIIELKNTEFEFKDYEEYVFRGLYPGIYDKNINPIDWYPNYIQTYIERDVRMIKNISDLNSFQKFIKLCAGRIGQVLNLSSIANDCGINHNTAKAWFSILQTSFIVFFIEPYHKNFTKRLIKMPKLYFYDTGLACSLLGLKTVEYLDTHYLKGNLFENFVMSEFIKFFYNNGETPPCYCWREKTGKEIDLIIDIYENTKIIEIKSGKTITKDYFKELEYFKKISNSISDNLYVIYGGMENQIRSYGNVLSWKNIDKIFYSL